jgi:aminoglycoside phosphotransferase (APT) family kinase protein
MTPDRIADDWFRQRRRIFYPKTDMPVPDGVLRGMRARTLADLGMTPDRVARAAGSVLGVAPAGVRPLDEQGTFHRVFRLSGVGGSDRLILRANAAGDFLHDLTLHLDAWAGATLGRAGLPAVMVRHVDLSRAVVPFDFQVGEESPGRPLAAFNDDEPTIRLRLRELGRLVARIHLHPLDGYGLLDARPLAAGSGPPRGIWDTWPEYVRRNLDAHVESCVRAGDLTGAGADAFLSALERHAGALEVPGGALLHGDLGSHNVLTDGDRLLGLIDWEDALAGDPVYDVAFWATFQPPERHAAFLAGYREVRPLPDDFPVRFRLYFVRILLAKAVHRRRFGYPDRPDRPTPARRIHDALENLARAA